MNLTYKKALCDGTHIAYLIFDENRFVGAGGVSFFQVLPTESIYYEHVYQS